MFLYTSHLIKIYFWGVSYDVCHIVQINISRELVSAQKVEERASWGPQFVVYDDVNHNYKNATIKCVVVTTFSVIYYFQQICSYDNVW